MSAVNTDVVGQDSDDEKSVNVIGSNSEGGFPYIGNGQSTTNWAGMVNITTVQCRRVLSASRLNDIIASKGMSEDEGPWHSTNASPAQIGKIS